MNLFNWLKNLDLFGSTVQLNYRKQLEYVTNFGALGTIIMVLFIASFFWNKAIQFINKETLFVQEQISFQTDPSLLVLNQHNYMFGVRIKQSNFLSRPFFNITLEQRNYYQNGSGIQQQAIILQLVPCTEQHWKKFDGSYNFTNYLKQNNYDFLCPRLEDEMYLSGLYNSQRFSFLKVYVSGCVNATSPRSKKAFKFEIIILLILFNYQLEQGQWDPICASQEDIQNELKITGVHGFSFIMTSSLINIQNQTQWNQYYLNDDHYFTFVPSQMVKNTNTFLRLYNLTSDVSLWPQDSIVNDSIFSYQTGDMQQTVELGRNDDKYAVLYVRRSPFDQKIQRRFQKISEFMSTLGGFIQLIFIIFRYFFQQFQLFTNKQIMNNSFIFKKYNEINLQIDLINQLYDFQLDETSSVQNKKQLNLQQLYFEENHQISKKQDHDQKTPKNVSTSFVNKKLDFIQVDNSVKIDSAIQINSNKSKSQNTFSKQNQVNQEDKYMGVASPTQILRVQLNKSNQKKGKINNNQEQKSLIQKKDADIMSQQKQNDQKKEKLNTIFYDFKIQNNSSVNNYKLQQTTKEVEEKIQQYFTKIQNEVELQQKLEQNKPSLFKLIANKFKRKKKEQNNKHQQQVQIQNNKNCPQKQDIPYTEKIKYVVYKFRQLIKEKEHLFLSSSIFQCFGSYKKKWQMLKKGFEYIKNDLDICIIIEKIQEMQKMKNLLFTQEQEIIFNFIPKPIITSSSTVQQINRRSLVNEELEADNVHQFQQSNHQNQDLPTLVTRMSYNTLGAYQILFESYLKVKHQQIEQSQVSNKLITYLGNELCELFDAYDFLLQNPQSTQLHKKINTLELSKFQNVQKGEIRLETEGLKKSNDFIYSKNNDFQQSVKLGLEQLNKFIQSQNLNQIQIEECEIENIESDTKQEVLTSKEMSIFSQISQQDYVSFNNNINQLNNNVVTNYYQKTIQGFINNTKKQ
ncbi:hypothetical protein ABPG74_003084 [Tetrahymena malaccensis]